MIDSCVSIVAATLLAGTPAEGTLLVSGYSANAVFRYDAVPGDFIDTLDPDGAIAGPLGVTRGPDGRLYVASESSNRVLRFESSTGVFVDEFVAPGTGGLTQPAAVLFGPDRNGDAEPDLYVSSFDGDSVLVFDGLDGTFVETFVTRGSGALNGPDAGMAFGPDGHLYVPSYLNSRILRYDGSDGSFLGAFVPSGSGGISSPRTVVFRPDGHMLVSCEGSDRVNLYDGSTGAFIETLIDDIAGPTGMALDSAGFLYVSSIDESAVYRYSGATGDPVDTVVSSGAGGLSLPTFVLLLEPCRGDVDGNGVVNFADILPILAAWGMPGGAADVDESGVVDFGDILVVLSVWGAC